MGVQQTGSFSFRKEASLFRHLEKNYYEKKRWHYGVCLTARDQSVKKIQLQSEDEAWDISEGSILVVQFSDGNTIGNPKFDFQNEEDPVDVKNLMGNSLEFFQWGNAPRTFVYDGQYWRLWEDRISYPGIVVQKSGEIIDDIARESEENFTISVEMSAPEEYSSADCTGILCVKAEGEEADSYILRGFDYSTETEEVNTYWRTSAATTENNITIHVTAAYAKV